MKENKAMAQEIRQISILYPKKSKEFYHHKKFRKSEKEVFCKKSVFKYFAIFTGKYLCWSLFLIKFIKKKHQHRCFSVNIARFLRASILQNICERLFERFSTGTNNIIVTSHIGSE